MGVPIGSARVVVSFTTKKSPVFDAVKPEFSAPSNYKDPAKISEFLTERMRRWESDEAPLHPHAAVIDTAKVVICKRLQLSKAATRTSIDCTSASEAADFLVDSLSDCWDSPEAPVFFGFDAKPFLRILSMETSMPGNTIKLPYKAWYGEGNTRELSTALYPASDSIDEVRRLFRVRGMDPKPNWVPHDDSAEDMRLSLLICTQLGLI